MGIESRPNMTNPTKGMSDATALLSWNSFLARLTKGPTASAKPIARKARKTGNVRSRISDWNLREYRVYRPARPAKIIVGPGTAVEQNAHTSILNQHFSHEARCGTQECVRHHNPRPDPAARQRPSPRLAGHPHLADVRRRRARSQPALRRLLHRPLQLSLYPPREPDQPARFARLARRLSGERISQMLCPPRYRRPPLHLHR